MVDFALDYDVLHSARDELYALADKTGSSLRENDFAGLGSYGGDGENVFGDAQLAAAFNTLYYRTKGPLEKAEEDLRQLGDIFGSVADTFFQMDAQIAEGAGIMSAQLGLGEWRSQHEQFLDGQAEDPGPPPTTQTITTPDGSTVTTELTLDDEYNVVTESTTITTSEGQTYSSTTTYEDERHYYTDTTYSDGSTAHADVTINEDGTGRMVVTDDEGTESVYTRPANGKEWEQISGPGMDDEA